MAETCINQCAALGGIKKCECDANNQPVIECLNASSATRIAVSAMIPLVLLYVFCKVF
jgi:hypothetical protein